MRGVRILAACLAATLALSGFMAATASAEVQEEPATQEAASAEAAEVAEETAEVAEEAAEEAGEAAAGTRAMTAKKRKPHPGYEYQLHHLTYEIRRLRRRKAEIRTHPSTARRTAALLHQKEGLTIDRSRRHEVRMELKEKELKEKA